MVLQRSGITYLSEPPAVQHPQEMEGLAWLHAKLRAEPDGSVVGCRYGRDSDAEKADEGEVEGADRKPGEVEPPLLVGVGSDAHQPELGLLRSLAEELADGAAPRRWEGTVHVHTGTVPCLSAIGALLQLRQRWPQLEVSCSFVEGPRTTLPAAPVPRPRPPPLHPALQLQGAVRWFLSTTVEGRRTGSKVDVGMVGTYVRVRQLWKSVSGTPWAIGRKKRPWHDKIKYFLRHRPAAFEVEGVEPCHVRLRGDEPDPQSEERVAQFQCLVQAVDVGMLRMLRAGKGVRDDRGHGGFVLVDELGGEQDVSAAWRQCKSDQFDSLAFFLRHCDGYEVRPGPGPSAREKLARVRPWL